MADRRDLFTFTICIYKEKATGVRKLGQGRYSIDIYKVSFIFEFWA